MAKSKRLPQHGDVLANTAKKSRTESGVMPEPGSVNPDLLGMVHSDHDLHIP